MAASSFKVGEMSLHGVVPGTPEKTTFEDIPTEILVMIVQDEVLQPGDLYNLALMSKTLNLLCLPLYFKAYGMEYPYFRVDIHGGDMDKALMNSQRVMSGLYAAVYLRPIPTLIFALQIRPDSPVPYRDIHFDRLRARVASATLFIRAIHSLDDVVIIGDEEWPWDTDQCSLPDFLLQEWATMIGDFMNALLEKGTSGLQVFRGQRKFQVVSYKFHQTLAIKIRHGVEAFLRRALPCVLSNSDDSKDSLNGLRGNGWEFRRPGKEGYSRNISMKVPGAVLGSTGLVRFHIFSAQFFLPPHLSWTLGILRMSPNLAALSLANIVLDKPGEYGVVLALIQQSVSPSLRELAFLNYCDNMSIDAIMQFLSKLESLEHLELGWAYDRLILTSIPPRANTVLLPNLRSLIAPIKASNYLLRRRPWKHNRLIKTWRTYYDLYCNHNEEVLATQYFNPLFSDLPRVLRHHERSSNEPLEIIMMVSSTDDCRGVESYPQVSENNKPLGGVNCTVVANGMLVYAAYHPIGRLMSTIFPDAVQVETELVHPAIVTALSNGKVPPQLESLLNWLAVAWPSVERLVLGSWVLNNISEGRDEILISAKAEEVYQLWAS